MGRNLHDRPRINLVHSSRRLVPTPRANHGEVIGLLRSCPDLAGPDLQIIFIDIPLPNPVAAVPNGFTVGVSPRLPVSRGSLRISSADPFAPPVLDPGYFTEATDIEVVLAGIEAAREIAGSAALAAWGVTEVAPGLDVTDEALLGDYARRNFGSYRHPVGTCAMGEDESSVVNSELRVHGLAGLRIADGSVIPAIPSANTNATVYA
ncbi:GMC oxidoreductase, partial [Streptomyces sp. NPDC059083]|uniref:GMC oxidoreductase n=1 Tax=Streptomyces sp. NPDC059083 TaxID=3346721 RepID=UPI0036BF1111